VDLVAPQHRPVAGRILDDAAATLRAWIGGQLIAMVVLAGLTALGLWILGVPYWLAFGIFTGVVAIVPFFGTLVSTALPALFVVGSGNWLQVVAVLLLGVAVHVAEANFVAPLIMQRKVALPPVLTIASVLVMGTLLGVIGLVVAVPILAVTLVVVRHVLQGEIYGDATTAEPRCCASADSSGFPRPRRRTDDDQPFQTQVPDRRGRPIRSALLQDSEFLHPLFPRAHRRVIDRVHGGKTVQDVLGFGGAIPVVGDFTKGLALGPTAVLIGIAPAGGQLPPEWKAWLRTAIERHLEIWSGLHTFIGDDPELGALARAKGVRILDARKPPASLPSPTAAPPKSTRS